MPICGVALGACTPAAQPLALWPLTCLSHRQLSLRTDLPVASTRAQLEEVKTPHFLGSRHLFSRCRFPACCLPVSAGSLAPGACSVLKSTRRFGNRQTGRSPARESPSQQAALPGGFKQLLLPVCEGETGPGWRQREMLRCREWGWEVSHLSDFGCCPHRPAAGGIFKEEQFHHAQKSQLWHVGRHLPAVVVGRGILLEVNHWAAEPLHALALGPGGRRGRGWLAKPERAPSIGSMPWRSWRAVAPHRSCLGSAQHGSALLEVAQGSWALFSRLPFLPSAVLSTALLPCPEDRSPGRLAAHVPAISMPR